MQHIDAKQVAARLDRRTLIDALDAAFRRPHEVPARHHHRIAPAATLLIMPAWDTSALGIKIVRYLSPAAASRLLMVGTGRLAPHLIESHALTRPLTEVRIWGRRADRARELAASFAGRGFAVEAAEDLESSVRWADIVSCATLSQEPLIRGAWLEPEQHLDLVGAFTREMREADDAAIARGALYVDTRAGALSESGELIGAIERGVIDAGAIRAELADLPSGSFARRRRDEITVFKSVGTALEDLVAAKLVLASVKV